MELREVPRRRPVTVIAAILAVVVVVGVVLKGWAFVGETLELPDNLARIWLLTNGFLAVAAFFSLRRNLNEFEDRWDWQELAVSRGMLLLILGAILGSVARAVDTPSVTFGTPLVTLGLLLIIQGAVRKPERFEA